MSYKKHFVYPYIPNSIPANKEEMFREINAINMEELYADIPESIQVTGKHNVPYRPHLLQNRKVPTPTIESIRMHAFAADVIEK